MNFFECVTARLRIVFTYSEVSDESRGSGPNSDCATEGLPVLGLGLI